MAEKEYIERDALCYQLAKQATIDGQPRAIRRAAKIVADFPAADVRSVVTCGKCKYGKYTGTEWFCDKHSGHADKFGEDASYHEYHSKHWFCADGEERKHE